MKYLGNMSSNGWLKTDKVYKNQYKQLKTSIKAK